jgi:hypothetical protein
MTSIQLAASGLPMMAEKWFSIVRVVAKLAAQPPPTVAVRAT